MKVSFSMRTPWSRLGACLLLAGAAFEAQACAGRLHIEVPADGVYALDYEALIAAQPGLADCASADLVLTQRDQEVPIRISGDRDGRFGANARIEWLGRALHGPQSWFDPYSLVNVYQLAARPGAHARVQPPASAASAPASARRTLHLEQENLLLRLNSQEMKPGDEPDVWQWARLTPIDAQPFTVSFDLPDADLGAAATSDVALTLDLRGVSNVIAPAKQTKPVDHVIEVSLNGKPLGLESWNGRDEWHTTLTLARALLKGTGNTLAVRVPKRALPWDASGFIVDAVTFNWFGVDYALRADSSMADGFRAAADGSATLGAAQSLGLFGSDGSYQTLTPAANGMAHAAVLRGVDYFPSSAARMPQLRAVRAADLREAGQGYDYLIVAHPRLKEAIEPLAQLHRDEGMKVAVLDVDDIYDQFSGGIIHPSAIRDLVAYGREHWTVKPRYLLLVGDASTDIRHDIRAGELTGNSYSTTAGATAAPVAQAGGFGAMVSYAYPEAQRKLSSRNLIPTWQFPSGEGQSASDNEFVISGGDFHPQLAVGRLPVVEPDDVKAIVDKTLAYVRAPGSGSWRRGVTMISTSELASFKQTSDQIALDLDRQGFDTKSIYTNANDRDAEHYQRARAALRDDLDGGNLLVHFLGHGGSYIWRVGAMGDLFSLDDVSALKNSGRYPMVMAMTCFSAPFDNPSDDSIGERFLRESGRGAIAVFAASWKNWPNPEYSRAFIRQLLTPGKRIGDAIVAGKATIADREFVEMYNLLGDPAVVLARPSGEIKFMRDGGRWDSRVVVRVPGSSFGGEVDVDWLDEHGEALSSAHYQLRDTQFSLPIKGASNMRVFASDSRTGFTAFGGADVTPPPPSAKPIQTKPVKRIVRAPHTWNPRDDISTFDFETRPIDAAPRTASDAQ